MLRAQRAGGARVRGRSRSFSAKPIMKPFSLLVLSSAALLQLAACGRGTSTAPSPAPAPARVDTVAVGTPAPEGPSVAASTLREPPRNWQLLDQAADGIAGISAERALRELLAGKQPRRTVVVAILDSGLDTAHADLRDNLWRNPKETPGNRADDDGNGYADDVYGWNFIGGADGRDVEFDTFELTRLYARCLKADSAAAAAAARQRCEAIRQDYDKQKQEAEQLTGQVQMIGVALARAVQILQRATGADSLTADRVRALQPNGAEQTWAKQAYLQLADNGITPEELEDTRKAIETRVKYHLDASYDPRPIVGDRYDDPNDRSYGNNNVEGPDADHGTHVAGIVAMERGNGRGGDGVANAARIMVIRAVPDGDERDKDVANAIRYAVDNGANVINMSFGKSYSPQKELVDAAVRYADERGVLLVHGSGNDAEDITAGGNFPTRYYLNGGAATRWIEVGASSWHPGNEMVAEFSNYSRERVDVFAPGVDIYSTVPDNEYEENSGTSMASPVVAGLAAMLMSYFPELDAAEIRQVILESATRYTAEQVQGPGESGRTTFGQLSVTGGVVNAFEAVRLAERMAAAKRN